MRVKRNARPNPAMDRIPANRNATEKLPVVVIMVAAVTGPAMEESPTVTNIIPKLTPRFLRPKASDVRELIIPISPP